MIRRYLTAAMLLASLFLAAFFIAEGLGLDLLTDPTPWLVGGTPAAALVGVGLLIGDVLLPVPSSLVMVSFGVQFGVVAGALLSLLGSVGAAVIGFGAGRRGGRLLQGVNALERAKAARVLARWGVVAVVVTRPLPIVAETVALLAGASPLGWGRFVLASVAGALPAAVLYAIAGGYAAGFATTAWVFAGVVAMSAAAWAITTLGQRALVGRTAAGHQ